MTARLPRPLAHLAVGCAALLILSTGCENAAARERAEAQEAIQEATATLALATLASTSVGTRDDAAAKLRDVVQTVSQLSEADDGQQVAGAMLAAAAHLQLAGLELADAERLESSNRRSLAEIQSAADSARRLRSFSLMREKITTEAKRVELAKIQSATERELRSLRSERAKLEKPITEQEAENAADRKVATRLSTEAAALRRQAAEAGPADGLPTFERALDREREMNRHELQIARRETDLQYELRPEHDLVAARVEFLESVQQEVRAAIEALSEGDRQTALNLEKTRELQSRFEGTITSALSALEAGTVTEVGASCEEAGRHLDRAVREASQAVRKSERKAANAPRLALVRSHEQQARLHLLRYRGLNARLALMQRLADDDAFVDAETWRKAIATVSAARKEAIESATTALQSARDEIEKVTSRGGEDDIQTVIQSLDVSLAALRGEEPPRTPEREKRPIAKKPAAKPASGGYETPEDLLAAIEAANTSDDLAAATELLEIMHTEDPEVRALLAMQRDTIEPTMEFISALREQFGDGSEEMMQGMGGGMSGNQFANPTIDTRTDDRVTIVHDGPAGPGTGRVDLILVGGSWMIDADSVFAGIDPAALAQAKELAPTMAVVMSDLAKRVRAGEFDSPDEVVQIMMGEMMKMMGGPGGGG